MKKPLNSTLTTASKRARTQKVVIECREVQVGVWEWWLLTDQGDVEMFDTASAALLRVKSLARKGNKGVTLTQVEWRDVPEGWKPPNE